MTVDFADPALHEAVGSNGGTAVAARLPDRIGENRVADIIRMFHGYAAPTDASVGQLRADLDRERSRLQHAVETLRAARAQLHQQFLQNQEQQQRVIAAIQEQWDVRRRNLEIQLASAALHAAREELSAERTRMLAEVRQQAVERESEFQQRELEWDRKRRDERESLQRERRELDARLQDEEMRRDAERRQLERDRREFEEMTRARESEWEQRMVQMERQLHDVRRKLVQAELTSVRDKTEWTAERRRWQDERTEAERIIRDLLSELESMRRGKKAA